PGPYPQDAGAPTATSLLAYHGSDINTAPVTRPGARVRRPALSIILTPPPIILRRFCAHPEFQYRGLVARFAFVVPGSLVGTRLYENRAANEDARLAYEAAIRRILSLPKPSDPDQIPARKIDGDALEVWRPPPRRAGNRPGRWRAAGRYPRVGLQARFARRADRRRLPPRYLCRPAALDGADQRRDRRTGMAHRVVPGRPCPRGPGPHGRGRAPRRRPVRARVDRQGEEVLLHSPRGV